MGGTEHPGAYRRRDLREPPQPRQSAGGDDLGLQDKSIDRASAVPQTRPPFGLLALIAAQTLCAVFFLGDVLGDIRQYGGVEPHLVVEMLAVLALIAGLIFEIRYILALLRRQARLQRSASLAAAAMADVIEAHFDEWRLTPAEHDVANLLVKGMSIAEIAGIRGSAEGTVKSQLNAIYRKSDTQNRGELLSLIIDSVMALDSVSKSQPR